MHYYSTIHGRTREGDHRKDLMRTGRDARVSVAGKTCGVEVIAADEFDGGPENIALWVDGGLNGEHERLPIGTVYMDEDSHKPAFAPSDAVRVHVEQFPDDIKQGLQQVRGIFAKHMRALGDDAIMTERAALEMTDKQMVTICIGLAIRYGGQAADMAAEEAERSAS